MLERVLDLFTQPLNTMRTLLSYVSRVPTTFTLFPSTTPAPKPSKIPPKNVGAVLHFSDDR